jgi:hypothetical protein
MSGGEFGLQMPHFGTYPLRRQFRYWRGYGAVHHNDGSRQDVGRPQRASQTPYRDVGADDPSRGADDDSEDTAAQLRSAAGSARQLSLNASRSPRSYDFALYPVSYCFC